MNDCLGRLDPNLLQQLGLALQFCVTGRKLISAQNESQHVNVLLNTQIPWVDYRHGPTRSLEQVAYAVAIPLREKRLACKRGCLAVLHRGAVAAGAFSGVDHFAALRLLCRIHAGPH